MSAQTSRYESDELPAETGTVEVVVIGGGAAGLNGALMPARSRRSVVVIDSGTPRNAPAAAMHGLIVLDGTPQAEILKRDGSRYASTAARSCPARWPRPDRPPRHPRVICGSPSA
ncbi:MULTISPECIES: FAD-binding protein [Streptosporangium]|uniref:Glycine/D-amino acid oxidase-like deaminating enzyme n=1 Tax=Streptosporangium brasiliense TaxID=47480 RepID=A0ABT9RKS1_9ACTN|nr:FAD-binding protein [Streptosporangium brasiliense]MDP9869896.1 glycine/D-amino acid oxidase-like deaminating enzyme [Streptosporangium brasiliense]